MQGWPGDLSSVLLDMDLVPPFHRRVYEAARGIPQGVTMTYGALAARIGAAGSARAVGKLSHETRLRSSCRAIGWSRPAAGSAVSPRMAAS
ncbi:MAG: MGMT family protein [Methylocella sp.]